ncbi:hypothetical protein SH1V18_30470 [Vallitalea longa]|uniref:Uncharacterized protein n=1 Tax=Vallitalea longa TaxID=2936439 RepID=A0A9W5YBR5_9FIRM|nr:hypothetical protein [Vallitalea longa]GKX30567.1 hypothetical protein SH1V18_30470 [Vallitalea longa]
MKKIKILISSLIVQVFVLILILINDFRCNSKLVIILLLSIYIIYNIKSLLEKYYLYKQDMENCPIEKVLKLMEVKRIYRTGTRNVANVPI